MNETIVSVKNVRLEFRLAKLNSKSVGMSMPQLNAVGGRIEQDKNGARLIALDDVSFELTQGDRVALIGHNGAGKTTLLRVLGGIYTPTSGSCTVEGRRSCLFSMGMGLNGEASLRENARLALLLYGLSHDQAEGLIADILEFADLTEFANMPLHACSNGMKTRLGFAVATSVSPDVLLVDEVLGAGDVGFAVRARAHLDILFKQSRVLVLSAHSRQILHRFCNKALWLEKGRVREFGDLGDVLERYHETMLAKDKRQREAAEIEQVEE